ncbi:MAG: hypothetical protein RI894_2553, partial [Bacteroidota bacterium]
MKFIVNIFLSYLLFVYIVRPFFAGLFGEKETAAGNDTKTQNQQTTR